ncbi:hypothetical protein LTR91_013538 [Friedmanniomyces endolithicus]|uniref:L-dopachrome isomerase n=1 Tax=Friedmanniomyces endolithicus TaxID=329885 RepID=A0AAN6KE30_9PEZI|nr:hypothetical protein LTR57_003274 [Friedmanniomyces endolithicus]KAK0976904.1 hypothetical protein LTR91_013538 [Friedmanniomyces endolithicus]KAK1007971.1 hypothetical protein LTS01_002468 [Friedmanniomyces endolithicus]KAK1051587.1 hypothetical protein LTS16_002459 [Friedmanniomyces endolithicus]
MPHSTRILQNPTNQYSAHPMTSTSTPIHAGNLVGTALTKRSSRPASPPQNPAAWKRTSSPIAEAYADLVGKGANIAEVMEGRQARDRTSLGQYNDASKHRTQYYEDQFRYKDGEVGTIRERVQRESPVIAELKTNVIIKDEFTLVTDLSYHLAQRYTRPDSSIMIKVEHSACLALGGTFDPCYILNITTLPSEMGPTMNKRNAALIQSFMADILSVSSDRGIVKFQPVEEANYAMDGTTMLGQIEKLEKHQEEAGSGAVRRAITTASRKSMPSFNKKSMSKLDTDVKTPNVAAGTNGITSVDKKRRSTSATPPPPSTIPNVFELSATDNERPSTANGQPFTAANGLRMNGISKEDLLAPKPTNERPKTIGGPITHRSVLEQSKNEAMPKPQRQSSYHSPSSKRSSMVRDEPLPLPAAKKPGDIPISPKPQQATLRPLTTSAVPPSALKSSSTIDTSSKPRPPSSNTYLDGVSTTTGASSRPKTSTQQYVDSKIDARAAEKNRQADSSREKDTAANTAKRRSTVTATPKMPPPPPVPEEKRRPEPRKRKSFLSAFRRN